MKKAFVSGTFDDLRSLDIRFLEEAAKQGALNVMLWSDELAVSLNGKTPKFSLEERTYLIQSIRYVSRVLPVESLSDVDKMPIFGNIESATWVVNEADDTPQKRAFCESNNLNYKVVKQADLMGFPNKDAKDFENHPHKSKVIVTGCYDWFHSGHVRFFEEASEFGDLYVVVGSDENVRFLKGDGHPMFPQEERRYVVQSIRFVTKALISSGSGWMDAEPEIAWLKPDIYIVNEDGDKPEKRSFCEERGIQYMVFKRKPKVGLPRRQSVELRGF